MTQHAPLEFAKDPEIRATDWIKDDKDLNRMTATIENYSYKIVYTDCRAGFDNSTEAYWSHLRYTHGVVFNQVEKKEDKTTVPQVIALEPNEKLDQRLTKNAIEEYKDKCTEKL